MTSVTVHIEQAKFSWPKQDSLCLDIPFLQLNAGEAIFLHGPSGCGKSTLLSLLAGVLTTSQGNIRVCERDWKALSETARDRHRADHVGYIFQQFNLLPYLSMLDNVLLPCRFSRQRRMRAEKAHGSIEQDATHWLESMGLPPSLWHRPVNTLSVGQQQRVAAARALTGYPSLIIADEPTSALDEGRQQAFLDLLLNACRTTDSTLILVSHDSRMAPHFDRQIALPMLNRAAIPETSLP